MGLRAAIGIVASAGQDQESHRSRDAIEQLGRRLIQLARDSGPVDDVVLVSNAIQPLLLQLVADRCRDAGYPLPGYLVAGRALEWSILDGVARPTTRFYDIYCGQIDVAFEYFRIRRMFVDRYILSARGFSVRQQARVAALVEEIMHRPPSDRAIAYDYLSIGMEVNDIAAKRHLPREAVRAVLGHVFRSARPHAAYWLELWSESARTIQKRRRRSNRSAKPPASQGGEL